MSDQCGAVLKAYAAQWNLTQSEVLYEAARCLIHGQAHNGCKCTATLLESQGIKLDNRAYKECYGYACRICKHDKKCRVGSHEGLWECDERYKHLLSPTIEPE